MAIPLRKRAHYDVAIIGSGPAGASVAYALSSSGAKILLIERGERIPREPQNWDIGAVFHDHRYRARETWTDARGRSFEPGIHYAVGGNSKVYAAVMLRFRCEDFDAIEYEDGTSPAWPITYDEISPFYDRAERLFGVHGSVVADPTEPKPRAPYPYGPIEHEPRVAKMDSQLRSMGLHPFPLPLAIDLHRGGKCIRCETCDAFPCQVAAKGDAETRCVDPAIRSGVELMTGTMAVRLRTSADGSRVEAVELDRAGERFEVGADTFVVSCGAINSAALLLRSAAPRHPRGLANASDQVGRNYMVHNSTGMMAIDPMRPNHTKLQKTLGVHDYYFAASKQEAAGSIQTLGKIKGSMLRADLPWVPEIGRNWLARHSIDWWVMSEDLPVSENRIRVDGPTPISIDWRPNNLNPHAALVSEMRNLCHRMGFPKVLSKRMGIAVTSHQCGTVRIGTDPSQAPLDRECRAFDVSNLYVVDGSVFPSSAAVNPTLTIVAMALRVATKIWDSTEVTSLKAESDRQGSEA